MFNYIKAYIKADTQALRDEASKAARKWLVQNGYANGGHWTDSYKIQFRAYTRSYINARLHAVALAAKVEKG